MWQLFDIAYVIPGAVFIGYWIGKYLTNRYCNDQYLTYSIMIAAILGFILTIVKIKRFVDEVNSKTTKEDERNDADRKFHTDSR
jgi:F0F1-type ATP synthase assembly protein I